MSQHMASWHGNAFRITGPLWREFAGHQWFPSQMGSNDFWWTWTIWWMNSRVVVNLIGFTLMWPHSNRTTWTIKWCPSGMYLVYPSNLSHHLCFWCFVMVWHRSILPISFRVTLPALWQPYDCQSHEAILHYNEVTTPIFVQQLALFRLTWKKISKVRTTGPLWGESTVTGGFHTQRSACVEGAIMKN